MLIQSNPVYGLSTRRPAMAQTMRHANRPPQSTVRFGVDPVIGPILFIGALVSAVGTVFGLTFASESSWGKTLSRMDSLLTELKKENVSLTEPPVVKEKDGKIGKQYQIRIGNDEYKVIEFRESKNEGNGGFYSQPKDILTSFRLEKVGLNKDGSKMKLKYTASVDGPDSKKPSKQVTYIDDFGVYETAKAKGHVIKKAEAIISALQNIDGEQRVAHFFEKGHEAPMTDEAQEAFFQQEEDAGPAKTAPAVQNKAKAP